MNLDVTHPAGPSRPTDRMASPSSPTIDTPAGLPPTSPGTADVLIAARKLIEDEKDWLQRGIATTREGHAVAPWDSTAAKWCAGGACITAGKNYGEAARDAMHLLDRAAGSDFGNIAKFNDSHSHAEVLAAFDRAIYLAHEGF